MAVDNANTLRDDSGTLLSNLNANQAANSMLISVNNWKFNSDTPTFHPIFHFRGAPHGQVPIKDFYVS